MHLYMQLAVALAPVVIATVALLSLSMARARAALAQPSPQQQQQQQQQFLAGGGEPAAAPVPDAVVPAPQAAADPAAAANGGGAPSAASASASGSTSASPPAGATASASSSAASPTGAAVPAGNSISLRFLHGEKALLTHVCDRTAPVHQLKRDLYPLLTASQPAGGSPPASASASAQPRVMLIFQGQLLRDERTLADYPAIAPGDIVHVHVIHAEAPASAAGAAAELRHRGPNAVAGAGPAAAALPQGEFLIPPRGVHFVNVGAVGAGGVVQPNHLWRALSVLMVAALGALWGMVLVWGSQLFTLNSLLCLMFLSGVAAVGIIQAIAT